MAAPSHAPPASIPLSSLLPSSDPAPVPAPDGGSAGASDAVPPAPPPDAAAAPLSDASLAPAPDAPATAAAVEVDHPKFLDTARVMSGDQVLVLSGIDGLDGPALDGLQVFVAGAGDRLICQPRPSGPLGGDPSKYTCALPDGGDIAAAALLNGAARANADATDSYRQQEAQARAARRGMWASLPPPPVTLSGPTLADTATLVVGTQSYFLDGIRGVGAPYTTTMQGYIAAHGNRLTCQPRDQPGSYVCLLASGEDIAGVALFNGAAEVAANATDAYRKDQAHAMNNRLGIWQEVSPQVVEAFLAEPVPPPGAALIIPPGDASDGVAYAAGVPEADIDGATVALVFAGAAGWGYYGPDRDWHRAPDQYWRHMDHFHPDGRGLPGWHDPAFRGGVHPGGFVGGGFHGGPPATPLGGLPPQAAPFGRPMEPRAVPVVVRPGPIPYASGRPAGPVLAGHAGMVPPGGLPRTSAPFPYHPVTPSPGFRPPGAPAFQAPGGFHPGFTAPMHPMTTPSFRPPATAFHPPAQAARPACMAKKC